MHRFRLRVGVGAATVLVLAVLAAAVLFGALGNDSSTEHLASPGSAGGQGADNAPAEAEGQATTTDRGRDAPALIHVSGAVRRPGVYAVAPGARVVEAIAAASGFTEIADTAAVNLARPIADGEQLHIPALGESGSGAASAADSAGQRLNLNRASALELEALPRVGPALAQRIIAFREQNGSFRTVEDLRAISGIGEQVFAGLRELVTV